MLKVNGLNCSHGDRKILENSSINLEKGKIVAVVGPNGIGKTTLLTSLMGLHQCQYLSYTIDNKELRKGRVDQMLRRGVFLLTENKSIIKELTVKENLLLCADKITFNSKIETIVQQFPSLAGKMKSIAGTLSGGEKQMLGLAKVLLLKPKYLLLDEPTSGLSPLMVSEVYRVIEALKNSTAILLVEQNPYLARKHADLVLTIKDRELVELPIEEALEKYYL